MTILPQRHSLVSQTAAILRDEIAKGTWTEWLPGERTLCSSLQVSRNTLRAALALVKQDGLIMGQHGSGNRITSSGPVKRKPPYSRDVALLTPDSLERMRPTQTLWIDELRAMLSERDCRLHVFHGMQFFRPNAGPALRRLIAQNRHGCWILALCNQGTQQWFERHRIPCIVAGSVYEGVDLPFRDLDHRAVCRHAVGTLLGQGHRRIALIMQKSRLAGDIESEAGYLDGLGRFAGGAEPLVRYHDSTPEGISSVVRRLTEQRDPPTAMIVANAFHYLTVASRLAQLGKRVPTDISLISRDEDPFLSFVLPTPAHYNGTPRLLAKSLLRALLELLDTGKALRPGVRLMPEFIKGASIQTPPGA
ncbi:MAG TPA: substrate-binding domain-containing protein [Opitutaceae bacterium]